MAGVAAALMATGCNELTGIDRFMVRDSGAQPHDGGGMDAATLDASGSDAGAGDAGAGDAGAGDASLVDAGPPPSVPEPYAPWNGYTTGSVYDENALRPTFRWHPVDGASRYRVELTSECSVSEFAACPFASPEVSEQTGETRFRPDVGLPVSVTAPVGRRYFWRVQACNAAEICSDWSPVRYLDVGRQRTDFNGDGYADLAVGAPYETGGAVYVFHGGPAGIVPRESAGADTVLHGTQADGAFGVVAAVDIDRDGYAELIVGAPYEDNGTTTDAGAVYLFGGGPAGIASGNSSSADSVLHGTHFSGRFGWSVASAGDIDGDGHADLVVGAPYEQNGSPTYYGGAYLFEGGPGGIASGDSSSANTILRGTQSSGTFGRSVATTGDIDGDGLADLVVGAPYEDNGSTADAGAAYLFQGDPTGIASGDSSSADTVLRGTQPGAQFGQSVASAGDIEADGYADLVVGAPADNVNATGAGAAYLFEGGVTGIVSRNVDGAETILRGTQPYGFFGTSVASAGDIDGDGLGDLIVGGGEDNGSTDNAGAAYLFYGRATGIPSADSGAADTTLRGTQQDGYFGRCVANAGDIDGDGTAELIVGAREDNGSAEYAGAAYVFESSTAAETIVRGTRPGQFGKSVASAY